MLIRRRPSGTRRRSPSSARASARGPTRSHTSTSRGCGSPRGLRMPAGASRARCVGVFLSSFPSFSLDDRQTDYLVRPLFACADPSAHAAGQPRVCDALRAVPAAERHRPVVSDVPPRPSPSLSLSLRITSILRLISLYVSYSFSPLAASARLQWHLRRLSCFLCSRQEKSPRRAKLACSGLRKVLPRQHASFARAARDVQSQLRDETTLKDERGAGESALAGRKRAARASARAPARHEKNVAGSRPARRRGAPAPAAHTTAVQRV